MSPFSAKRHLKVSTAGWLVSLERQESAGHVNPSTPEAVTQVTSGLCDLHLCKGHKELTLS